VRLRRVQGSCEASRLPHPQPEHYQIVAYEHGKLLPHPRTARVLAAALNVPLPLLVGEPSN
jgi:hypothetical protein